MTVRAFFQAAKVETAQPPYDYGLAPTDATTSVTRTFNEAISGGRNDCYLVLLEGANHFTMADPFDSTTGRAFLDFRATQPEKQLRALMADIICLFIDTHVRHQPEASQALNQLLALTNPLIQYCASK